jgi:hypothetical protein
LVLEARDVLGLRADRASDLFRVTLEPAPGQERRLPLFHPAIHDLGDSTYALTVTAAGAGNYHLMVRSQEGAPASGCPVLVMIRPAASAASRTVVEGDGARVANVGKMSSFLIVKRDVFGNVVSPKYDDDGDDSESGGAIAADDDLVVSIIGPDGEAMPCRVAPDYDQYAVSWAPSLAGRYSIAVKVDRDHILNSPFRVVVSPGPTCVPMCEVSGKIVESGRWHAGAVAKIKVITATNGYVNVSHKVSMLYPIPKCSSFHPLNNTNSLFYGLFVTKT